MCPHEVIQIKVVSLIYHKNVVSLVNRSVVFIRQIIKTGSAQTTENNAVRIFLRTII